MNSVATGSAPYCPPVHVPSALNAYEAFVEALIPSIPEMPSHVPTNVHAPPSDVVLAPLLDVALAPLPDVALAPLLDVALAPLPDVALAPLPDVALAPPVVLAAVEPLVWPLAAVERRDGWPPAPVS
jgi:hypothetical protein